MFEVIVGSVNNSTASVFLSESDYWKARGNIAVDLDYMLD